MDEPLLPTEMPDQETFERVWRRVMPDQDNCPLSLSPPAPPETPTAPVPAPAPSPVPGEADLLALLLGQSLHECAALRQLACQSSRSGRRLSAMADRCRESCRRLAAARFLLTGEDFHPRPMPSSPLASFPLAIRERYLAARQIQALCTQGATQTQDPVLRTLLNRQAGEAQERAEQLLTLLEQFLSIS